MIRKTVRWPGMGAVCRRRGRLQSLTYIYGQRPADVLLRRGERGRRNPDCRSGSSERKGDRVARTCKKKIHHLKLVLVIDRLEWPEHLFDLQPDSLLFSPLDKDEFQRTILRLEQMAQQEYKRCLTLVTKGKIYRIPYQKILYVESMGHQLCVKTWEEEIRSYGKLDDLLDRLPPYFLHCHKSYLINLNYVRQLRCTGYGWKEKKSGFRSAKNIISISKQPSCRSGIVKMMVPPSILQNPHIKSSGFIMTTE